jgi:hypothetical protein
MMWSERRIIVLLAGDYFCGMRVCHESEPEKARRESYMTFRTIRTNSLLEPRRPELVMPPVLGCDAYQLNGMMETV